MYAKGMTTGDIESHMRELYDIDISDSTISRITDKILPIVKEWQERPLEEVYAVVFLEAIHFHVRSEGRIVKQAVYIAIGIDMSGKKGDGEKIETPEATYRKPEKATKRRQKYQRPETENKKM